MISSFRFSLLVRAIILFLCPPLLCPFFLHAQIIDSTETVSIPSLQIGTVRYLLVRDTAAAQSVVVGAYTIGGVSSISTDSLAHSLLEAGYAVQSLTRVRDTVVPVIVTGSYLLAGARGLPADNLSRFLAENGFGENFPTALGLSLGIGGTYQITPLRLAAEFCVTWPPYNTTLLSDRVSQEVQFDAWGVRGELGWQFLPIRAFELYSFIGLGVWHSNLTINQMNHVNGQRTDTLFSGIFNDSVGATYAFSNGMANFNVGIGIEYNFPFTRSLVSDSFLALGLRAEYAMGFSDSWSRVGSTKELPGGPDMSTGEFNFWVTMAFKTRSFRLRFQ